MSNQAGQFSIFDFGPRVVDKKARYRDEEKRKYLKSMKFNIILASFPITFNGIRD